MGEVYRADDLKLGQIVALKFLPKAVEKDEARRVRFLQEVKIARQISHTNVCRVYDVGDVDGRHFISMEYVDGEDLAALLRRIGRLPKDKAVQISRQLCAGLAAAHEQGVLHRDLKPANVMIDGRGKARITDFGLAELAAGAPGINDGGGTPAYMAPEQLSGGAASIRSDVYALGLVLYELFTGHKPFDASTALTDPSAHVEGFDPAVERVILRCLRTDPRERPAGALAVAASLPGGDPLAAALAAGETPSPELVAEAGEVGGLRPAVAWGLLSAAVAGTLLVVLLSGRTQLMRLVPLDKPPEVLTERARTIAAELGYTDAPKDFHIGFDPNVAYLDSITEHDRSASRWARLKTAAPSGLIFWYRQSPSNLLPYFESSLDPTSWDPPPIVPGMVGLSLDTRGRLSRFQAVPAERDDDKPAGPEPDWSLLLKEAGLDRGALNAAEPRWVPAVHADRRVAWEGLYPGQTEPPIRIEAASYRGHIVSFRIIYPWTKPSGEESGAASLIVRFSALAVGAVLLTILVGGIFLARQNLRVGRGDRKGASRVAIVVFAFGCLSQFLQGHYSASLETVGRVVGSVSFPLLIAAAVWIFYLALEPYLRRLWPQMIVSWVRLLDGRFGDPLIGRDALIGLVVGVLLHLGDQCYQLAAEHWGLAAKISDLVNGPPVTQTLVGLVGMRQAMANLSAFVSVSLLFPLATLVLLLLCRVVLQRQAVAVAVFLLLMNVTGIPSGVDLRAYVVWGLVSSLVWVIVAFRFGLLSLIVTNFTWVLLVSFPLTFDASAWYFGRTVLALAVIGAMAAYGYRTAVSRGTAATSRT